MKGSNVMGGSVDITDVELERINAERRRQGKAPLTREEARQAISASGRIANPDPGFDWFGFYVGYETGSPFPFTTGAIMGSMLHQDHHSESSTSSSYTPPVDPIPLGTSAPAYTPPEPISAPDPSPSYNDSAGFSSSSDSSSSSSSDSGSSGGGGD